MFRRNTFAFLAFYIIFLFSTAVISFYPAYTIFIRALSLIIFTMNTLLFILYFPEIQKHRNLFLLTLVACLFPLATVTAGVYQEQHFVDNMASAIHIYNLIFFVILSSSVNFSNRQIKWLLFIPVIGLIFLMSYYHIIDFIVAPFLWPPNDIAKSYFYMLMSLILWHYFCGSNKLWIFLWIIAMFILSYRIQCRSTLLATICFSLLCCFDFWIKRPLIYRSIMNVLIIGSIVFAAIYVYLYLNFFRMDLSWAFHQAGKGIFSGRETIWIELFTGLKQHPLLGMGREALAWSVTWNTGDTHNSSMYILCLFGVPLFLTIIILINKTLSYFQLTLEKDIVSRRALYAFLSMLLMGFFESNVVTTPFITFTFFMFFIINSRRLNMEKI